MGTGVTKFIKLDEVRREIDSTYPNPGEDVDADLEVENNGYGHRLIGSAFEFLCELLLNRRCEEVIYPAKRSFGTKSQRWTGDTPRPVTVQKFDGMRWEDYSDIDNREEWEERYGDRSIWNRRRSAIKWTEDEELSKLARQYIQTGMNTEGVVKAALINAGWKPQKSVHSWINREAFEEDVLDEMEALFELLRRHDWTDGTTVLHKPNFGSHQHILPGQGDFIVDDLLVDIKTTENPTFSKSFWRQLLMYYLLTDIQRILHDIDGRTYEREPFDEEYPEINRVGVYFARYGELQSIEMDSVITDREEYEEFRAWIVDKAIEENRHPQYNYSDMRAILTEPYDYQKQRTLFDDF